jgi:hypothetical protein
MNFDRLTNAPSTSLRANGSRECAPDDRLRDAIQKARKEAWIASALALRASADAVVARTPKKKQTPKVLIQIPFFCAFAPEDYWIASS